ncbi:MAG: cobalt ECF transporter T component CbiQ [Gemmatimonadota bacterium]|jgi:cobalt/nickel transport system permease protein
MSFHHLDRYADLATPVTRLAPTARVLATVVVALAAALLPLGAWPQMALLTLLVLGIALIARIPLAVLATRLGPPLGFVLLVSAALPVLVPGTSVMRIGPLSVSDGGLLRFGSVVGRALPALGIAVVLVSTLRFTELVQALRDLRLPGVVTTALGLAYRYLYILTDEIEQLQRAARSRNAGAGSASRRHLLVGITAASLGRSFARSERVHQAMLARGYRDRIPALRPHPMDRTSAFALAGVCVLALGIMLTARL